MTILQEINLGALACRQIKSSYFEKEEWVNCHKDVAKVLTKLKQVCRAFYSGNTELEMLMQVSKYTIDDIKHALEEQG